VRARTSSPDNQAPDTDGLVFIAFLSLAIALPIAKCISPIGTAVVGLVTCVSSNCCVASVVAPTSLYT